jgi:hypothetical protein
MQGSVRNPMVQMWLFSFVDIVSKCWQFRDVCTLLSTRTAICSPPCGLCFICAETQLAGRCVPLWYLHCAAEIGFTVQLHELVLTIWPHLLLRIVSFHHERVNFASTR